MSSDAGYTSYIYMLELDVTSCKERSIRKLIGGGGAGVERAMKIFAQGKINKKVHARQLTQKFSCSVLKKIIQGKC